MWIALAVIGWIAFVVVLVQYRVGVKIDVRDENALAVYAVCLMLEEKFRTSVPGGFRQFISEQAGESPEDVLFWVMKAVKKGAIEYSLPNAEPLNSYTLGMHCIRQHLPKPA